MIFLHDIIHQHNVFIKAKKYTHHWIGYVRPFPRIMSPFSWHSIHTPASHPGSQSAYHMLTLRIPWMQFVALLFIDAPYHNAPEPDRIIIFCLEQVGCFPCTPVSACKKTGVWKTRDLATMINGSWGSFSFYSLLTPLLMPIGTTLCHTLMECEAAPHTKSHASPPAAKRARDQRWNKSNATH